MRICGLLALLTILPLAACSSSSRSPSDDGAFDLASLDEPSSPDPISPSDDRFGPEVGTPDDAPGIDASDGTLDPSDECKLPDCAPSEVLIDLPTLDAPDLDDSGDAALDHSSSPDDAASDVEPDAPKPPVEHCKTVLDCSDWNLCTWDECIYQPGDAIGHCTYTDNGCDDLNPCTWDKCVSPKELCEHTPFSGGICHTANVCNVSESCDDGVCKATHLLNCDDGNACTEDTCDPVLGCQHRNTEDPCSDGDRCTANDTCKDGVCVSGPPLVCPESPAQCGNSHCDHQFGCRLDLIPGPCDDGNACTINDKCGGGFPSLPFVSCDGIYACPTDDNPCTEDCDPAAGCTYRPKPDGTECVTGLMCYRNGKCDNGTCIGQLYDCGPTYNPCTEYYCDDTYGCVDRRLVGIPCDDQNVCTTGDTCNAYAACVGTGLLDCDDGIACTLDSCDRQAGCMHTLDDTCECKGDGDCRGTDAGPAPCCRYKNVVNGFRCTATGCG